MKKSFFLIAIAMTFCSAVIGQSLVGNWGFQTYPRKNQVCVYGHKIVNQNTSGRTGTLKIALWATLRPYSGGRIYGYCLFEKKFDPLSAGYIYKNINELGRLYNPKRGRYYLTILLLEYNRGAYEIVDWIGMNGCFNF